MDVILAILIIIYFMFGLWFLGRMSDNRQYKTIRPRKPEFVWELVCLFLFSPLLIPFVLVINITWYLIAYPLIYFLLVIHWLIRSVVSNPKENKIYKFMMRRL